MTDDPYDELDRGLLHAVHLDARAPFRRLGEVLGVSDQTVARRYVRLRESGALRVTALSDPGRVQWLLRVRAVPSAAVTDIDRGRWITRCNRSLTGL